MISENYPRGPSRPLALLGVSVSFGLSRSSTTTMNHSEGIRQGQCPTPRTQIVRSEDWDVFNTDTNTTSLQWSMDIIPDAARALFLMVQARAENAPKNLATSFAAAATSATPSFGGGASSSSPALRSKTTKKTGTKMLKISCN